MGRLINRRNYFKVWRVKGEEGKWEPARHPWRAGCDSFLHRITGLDMLRRPEGRLRGSGRLGHFATLHSHASLHPHFVGPSLCFAKPLSGPPKRHIQPKRYTPCSGFSGYIFCSKIWYKKKGKRKFLDKFLAGGEHMNPIVVLHPNSIRVYKIFLLNHWLSRGMIPLHSRRGSRFCRGITGSVETY
jgi:hypothetical protein